MNDNQYQTLKNLIIELGFTDTGSNHIIDDIEIDNDNGRVIDLYELFEIEPSYTYPQPFHTLGQGSFNVDVTLDVPKLDSLQLKSYVPLNPHMQANLTLKQPTFDTYQLTKIDTLTTEFSLQPKLKPINVSQPIVLDNHFKSIDVTSSIANINDLLNSVSLNVGTKPFIKKDKSLKLPKNMMNKPIMKRDYKPKSYLYEPNELNTLIELPSVPNIEVTNHKTIDKPTINIPDNNLKQDYTTKVKSMGLDVELDDKIPDLRDCTMYIDSVKRIESLEGVAGHMKAFKGFFLPFLWDTATDVYQSFYMYTDPIQMNEILIERLNEIIEDISDMYMEEDVQTYIEEGY